MPKRNIVIHYTDLSFQRYCEEKYGINRGIYNTIENWFYENGETNIINRRLRILEFLNYVAHRSIRIEKARVRFGHGGLKSRLDEFMVKTRDFRQTV